jgi:hypothetical protein
MSTAAVGSGHPTPAEALPQPLPEGLSQPREKTQPKPARQDSEQAAQPATSSLAEGSRLFDVSILSALVGLQLAWLALLAVVILAFIR